MNGRIEVVSEWANPPLELVGQCADHQLRWVVYGHYGDHKCS